MRNLVIYTDGSTRIKNKKGANNIGGYGYVVYDGEQLIDAFGEQVENTTNNRMELTALNEAIQKYGTKDPWEAPIIYTDSQYALMCLTVWGKSWERNGWLRSNNKEPENLDLVQRGIYLLEFFNAVLKKCDGHSGIIGNELADQLATGLISSEEVLKRYGLTKSE